MVPMSPELLQELNKTAHVKNEKITQHTVNTQQIFFSLFDHYYIP